MTQAGSVYGEALYDLAKAEGVSQQIYDQLCVLEESFRQEAGFLRLLHSPNLSKEQRCSILDESFRGKVHTYVLNFLKILTEKDRILDFHHCCDAYREHYYLDSGILPVTAVTAVALSAQQSEKLTEKLSTLTGKQILLTNRVESGILGGVRLDYDGKRLDDTVSHRLDTIRNLLKTEVL